MIPLNRKLRLSPGHFGVPCLQISRQRRIIDPDYHGEIEHPLHERVEKGYAWNQKGYA